MKGAISPLFLLTMALCLPAHALSADASGHTPSAGSAVPIGFSEAARRLIIDSPFLKNSSIEVDLRRMDERDSRYAVLPSVSLRTRYFVNPPDDLQGKDPYSIDFVIEAYNPVEKYYTIEVRKIITTMAVLHHLKVISESLERLGMAFLDLEGLDGFEQLNHQGIGLSEKYAAYLRICLEAGSVTPLELSVVELEMEIGRAELEKIAASRKSILNALRGLLGLPDDQHLDFAFSDVTRQVIGDFDPAAVSFHSIKENAFELQIHNLKLELQKRHVTLARAKYLPNLLLGLQTTDPLGSRSDNGLFFSIGFELPLWDGLRRFNDIERQQTVLRQYQAEEEIIAIDLASKWDGAHNRLAEATTQLKLAHAQVEMAGRRATQVERGYQAGIDSYASLLAEQRRGLDIRRNLAMKSLEHRKALLTLHKLSGDLMRRFVDPGAWQDAMN